MYRCLLKVIDLDDTLVNTTADLRGDLSRVEKHLTPANGANEFLELSPERNILLSYTEEGEAGYYAQEAKITKFGWLKYFPTREELLICPSLKEKKEKLEHIVSRSGLQPTQVVVIGDRPEAELRWGAELGCTVVRMCLPRGKYSREFFNGYPHFCVTNWYQVMALPFFAAMLVRRA
jgi:FMN phosphatase YigB (HAD superfamily)